MSDDHTPDSPLPERDDDFENRARQAGRALRQDAPPGGLRRIERAKRNRRIVQGASAAAVVALGVGAIAVIAAGRDGDTTVATLPTTAQTTVPETTAATIPDTTPGTNPATVPSTNPTPAPVTDPPTVPDTTPETVADTTSPPTEAVPAAPHSIWLGTRLLGYFDDDVFVGNPGIDATPDDLMGAQIALQNADGDTATATVVEGCYETEVDFGSDKPYALWHSSDAPLVTAGPDTDDGLEQMNADLAALGADPAFAMSWGNTFTPDGSADRLLFYNPESYGEGDIPPWLATWDDATGEFTTIDGGPDEALSLGEPVPQWIDTDGDGNFEVAYSVGDAYVLKELGSGDVLAGGTALPC